MKLLKKLKKDNKGFTLVEIIVVLVILAIIAAFTIPSMLGFVNDAKKKSGLAEARAAYIAAQAVTTEGLANKTASADIVTSIQGKTGQMGTLVGSDCPGAISGVTIDATTGKVTKLVYTMVAADGGYVYTYTNGDLTIT